MPSFSQSVSRQTFVEPHGHVGGAQAPEPEAVCEDSMGERTEPSRPLFPELTCGVPGP